MQDLTKDNPIIRDLTDHGKPFKPNYYLSILLTGINNPTFDSAFIHFYSL